MVLLAFDDTDSVRGGCTTHAAYQWVQALEEIDLIGPPRLVRLNPTIPHKTRGNGAVVLRLGRGRGSRLEIGEGPDGPIHAFPDGEPASPAEAEAAFHLAQRLIQRTARLEDDKTHPGLVMVDEPLNPLLYDAAVHRYVGQWEAFDALQRARGRHAGWKRGRGILGAAAACAWPAREGTYERILYRRPENWGTPRGLDAEVGRALDRHHPSTFDNYDQVHHHLRIAPASPCPVLAGIRGTDASELRRASDLIGPEAAEGSLLFWTNQATDDHLRSAVAAALRPFGSATLDVTITQRPVTTRGGHTFARANDGTGAVDLAAFEPTKGFRDVVRTLRPGDAVRAHGSVSDDPTLFSLEKLEVLESLPRRLARPPECGPCRRRMKSRGRDAGYRCPSCRSSRSEPEWSTEQGAVLGAFEVPTLVRRHLARPLRLPVLARRSP